MAKKVRGGRGGIRTHGTLSRTPVFKTGLVNHLSTLPVNISFNPRYTGVKDVGPPRLTVEGYADRNILTTFLTRAGLRRLSHCPLNSVF